VEEATTRDVNGNILETGDTCVLTQDLAKGKLKRGQRLKIRLGDFGDGHDCEATIAGIGTYALKSQFLKKV
jgi:protein PhnA